MKSRAVLRFIHASNLRLGQVVSGVGPVSDELRQTLLDAPWQAAASVFEQALACELDFVLLNGDVVPAGAESGRAVAFLQRQFASLNQHGIAVYLRVDADVTRICDAAISWPDNVHFVSDDSEESIILRNGQALASIASGLEPPASDGFSIAVADGSGRKVTGDYQGGCGWSRDDSVVAGQTVHHPGLSQGLGFHEAGATGCSLVELDHNSTLSIALLETSAVRWETCRLSLPAGGSAEVEELLFQQIADRVSTSGPLLLFRFVLDVEDTASALGLEAVDLVELRRRVHSVRGVAEPQNYRVLSIEPGAGMLVEGNAADESARVTDFRRIVLRRSEGCVRELQSRGVYRAETPPLQLLNGVARFGRALLS